MFSVVIQRTLKLAKSGDKRREGGRPRRMRFEKQYFRRSWIYGDGRCGMGAGRLFCGALAPGEPDDGGGDEVGACDGHAQRERDGEREHQNEQRGAKKEPHGDAEEAEFVVGVGHGKGGGGGGPGPDDLSLSRVGWSGGGEKE